MSTKVTTALALGVSNFGRVLAYRVGMKLGLHPVRRLRSRRHLPPFFEQPGESVFGQDAVYGESDHRAAFGWIKYGVGDNPPDWHANTLTHQSVKRPDRPWWRFPDFDEEFGDIKAVWEMSRFDWVVSFSQRVACGDLGALHRLNSWLGNWCDRNPCYRGPNWMCGQEAAIRVMHLSMGAVIMRTERRPLASLLGLIVAHLQRIAATLPYGMAQDNNHGTSEAAALWIGGSWLAQQGDPRGLQWEVEGRNWLEDRVARLIEDDGSFSQHSLNYHRLVLDTLCIVEVWRQRCGIEPFSSTWYARARAATRWLLSLVDERTGDGPNLGANDGARLLPLASTDHRDYRPSVHLASVLFAQRRGFRTKGVWDLPLTWLGLSTPEGEAEPRSSEVFDKGGYALLRRYEVMCLLRYPRFRFRPSHADALHVDLWIGGANHLRDGGSFSYNSEREWLSYFSGTASHNTVQFDDRDQMPRLGRFLFGDWLKTEECGRLVETSETVSFRAGYCDSWGARHHRKVTLRDGSLLVNDTVSRFQCKAVLRWRLRPGAWQLNGGVLTDGTAQLTVTANVPVTRLELVEGWESRYYLQKTALPVLEVEVEEAGVLETNYRWNR